MKTNFSLTGDFLCSAGIATILLATAYRIYLGDDPSSLTISVELGIAYLKTKNAMSKTPMVQS